MEWRESTVRGKGWLGDGDDNLEWVRWSEIERSSVRISSSTVCRDGKIDDGGGDWVCEEEGREEKWKIGASEVDVDDGVINEGKGKASEGLIDEWVRPDWSNIDGRVADIMKVRIDSRPANNDDKIEQQPIDAVRRERRERELKERSGRLETELKSSPAPEPIETARYARRLAVKARSQNGPAQR